MSLMDTYLRLNELDAAAGEKTAAEKQAVTETAETMEDAIKLASEYEEAGRALARVHFDQFVSEKIAENGFPFPMAEAKGEEKDPEAEAAAKKKKAAEKKNGEGTEEEKADAKKEEKKASIAARLRQDPAYREEMIRRYAHRA